MPEDMKETSKLTERQRSVRLIVCITDRLLKFLPYTQRTAA